MIALKIHDTEKMIHALLDSPSFDSFGLQEAVVTKAASLLIEGRIHPEYYTAQDYEDDPQLRELTFISWAKIRPVISSYMKGDHAPLSYKIVMQAPIAYQKKLLGDPSFTDSPENVQALILTFRFQGGELTCLTGTSMKTFSLDKSLDALWDHAVQRSLANMQIAFDQL